MGDSQHQDFISSYFVDDNVRKFLRHGATNWHVIGERFKMRIVERMLLDPQQDVVKDTQETTSKSRLPAFIPSTGLMGFSLRKL